MNKSVDIRLPKKSKYWDPAVPMKANGMKMTFRERMIYEAGFKDGQSNTMNLTKIAGLEDL